MIVREYANRGTLPCRDEGNPVLSYMILNYNIGGDYYRNI